MSETTSPSTSVNAFDNDMHATDAGAPMWHQPELSPQGGSGGGRVTKKTAKKAAKKAATKKTTKKAATKKSPSKPSATKGSAQKATTKKAAKKTAKKAVMAPAKPTAKAGVKVGGKPARQGSAKKAGVTSKSVTSKNVTSKNVTSRNDVGGRSNASARSSQATVESLERAGVKEGDLELGRSGRPAMVDEPTPRRGTLGHVPRPTQDELPDVPAAQPAPGEERADVGDRSDVPDRGEVDRGERDGPKAQDVDAARRADGGGRGGQSPRHANRGDARRDNRQGGDRPRHDQARQDQARGDRGGRPEHRAPDGERREGGPANQPRSEPRSEPRRDQRAHAGQGPGKGQAAGTGPRQHDQRGPDGRGPDGRGPDGRGGRPPSPQAQGAQAAPVDSEKDRRNGAPSDQHEPLNPETFDTAKTFADLGLHPSIVRGVSDLGFRHPTHIQSRLVPVFLTGKDILGQAKTGTGKTAAFALPLLHMVTRGEWGQALILAPTRELAIQIHAEFGKLGKHMPVRAVPIYGGQPIKTQAEKLERGAEIIVGTPGRVMDMIERRLIDPRSVRFAVLDEVDRMLDIGFREDIRRILSKTPSERQTVMVSATIRGDIEDLARRYMRQPEKLVTTAGALTVDLVEQHYLSVDGWDKRRLLHHLLTHEAPALTLVFCRLKRTVDELASHLNRHGIEAHAMHGDMSQSKRNSTMRQLRAGQLAVLIASDLASRGIDVDGISHVVNYDLPEDPDVYVHRIGRTARAGRDGVAWSFVTAAQGKLLTQIENLINAQIPKLDYPDFKASPRPDGFREEPTGGRPIYEVQGVEKARNRYAETERPDMPAAVVAMKADPAKFPGGIVPTKLPPNRMRGRVRSGR